MSFISYAQNFEDVMLWRAFKHIEQGFYIDVGANDPNIDSVTKAFYERRWRGINIEPLMSHYEDLQVERPRDINLCCAAGETSGEIEVFECDIRGWATAEQSVADKHVQEGHEGVYHRVLLRTLSDICQEYVSGEIHFLKIDVEGLEKDVISGADFQIYRPWVVVVEATKPNSTEEVHEQWESLLLAVNYQFAYADGLNRFYVAAEHPEILSSFKYPPNVFDGFILSAHMNSEAKAQQAEVKVQQADVKAQQTEAALNAIYNSRSWRITMPLRSLGKAGRWFEQGSIAWLTFAPMSRPRRALKGLFVSLKHTINGHPKLKMLTLQLLSRFPRLKERLENLTILTNDESVFSAARGGVVKSLSFRIINYCVKIVLKFPWMATNIRRVLNRLPRLKLSIKNYMGIESARSGARCFDDLTSVRIMNSMLDLSTDPSNNYSVVFLKVPNEPRK